MLGRNNGVGWVTGVWLGLGFLGGFVGFGSRRFFLEGDIRAIRRFSDCIGFFLENSRRSGGVREGRIRLGKEGVGILFCFVVFFLISLRVFVFRWFFSFLLRVRIFKLLDLLVRVGCRVEFRVSMGF